MKPITIARPTWPLTDAERAWLKAPSHFESQEILRTEATTEGVVVIAKVRVEMWRHTSPDYKTLMFNVRSLKDAIADDEVPYQMIEMIIGQDYYQAVRDNNGIEAEKLANMPVKLLDMPGIAALLPCGSLQLIDGSHRLVRLCQCITRRPLMRIIVLPGEAWARHLLDRDDTDGNEAMRRLFEVS